MSVSCSQLWFTRVWWYPKDIKQIADLLSLGDTITLCGCLNWLSIVPFYAPQDPDNSCHRYHKLDVRNICTAIWLPTRQLMTHSYSLTFIYPCHYCFCYILSSFHGTCHCVSILLLPAKSGIWATIKKGSISIQHTSSNERVRNKSPYSCQYCQNHSFRMLQIQLCMCRPWGMAMTSFCHTGSLTHHPPTRNWIQVLVPDHLGWQTAQESLS